MAAGLHISISAEKIATLGSLEITNSMFSSLIVSFLLILVAVIVRTKLQSDSKPTGLQNFAEFVIESLENLVASVTNDKRKTRQFFPFIATFFLFIIFNNWFGLIPGVGSIGFLEKEDQSTHAYLLPSQVKSPNWQVQAAEATDSHQETTTTEEAAVDEHEIDQTSQEHQSETDHVAASEEHAVFVPYFRGGTADINMTLALGLISIILTQFFGLWHQKLGYLTKFFNFSNPIMFFVGLLELVSEVAKVISFAFRLFGNIFAGEVLLVVIIHLTKVVIPMPFYGLEIFVGFVQALVFAMLSLVFFNMATLGHSEH